MLDRLDRAAAPTVSAVGIRSALRLVETTRATAEALSRASLLSSGDLSPEAAQAFGINTDSVSITRAQAMRVPALKRGRRVITDVVSSLPLVELDPDGHRVTNPPAWLTQPEAHCPLSTTLTWTTDDLIFHGLAWWRVTERYASGWPARFERLDPARVMVVYPSGEVYVDGHLADDADLVRFDGPDEGILRTGADALATALELDRATRRLAKLDVPLGYLTPEEGAQPLSTEPGSGGDPADPDASEVDVLLDDWEDARATRNTAFLNRAVRYVTTQLDATKIQLTEQRQQQAVEVARLLNLDPRYVAAPTGDSTTYATSEGNRRELLDISLAGYVNAIEQRLSMGDVTARGHRVRLARAAWMRGDLSQVMAAAQAAHAMGAITLEEIRAEFLGLPPIKETPTNGS